MKKRAFTLMELALIFFIMAILAILFYRTLKPNELVFNKLYYSAYTQMEDAYREVLAFSETDNAGNIQSVYDANGVFDINEFPEIFSRIVNFIGVANDFAINAPTTNLIDYSETEGRYNVFDDINQIEDTDFQATLTNNMRLRFDLFEDCRNCPHKTDNIGNQIETPLLILTLDINGDTLPNKINKDIIQFEINGDGIFPIGEIETNTDLMQFNIMSSYSGEDGAGNPYQRENVIIQTRIRENIPIDYASATCLADTRRHTYYTDNNKDCGIIEIINPHCRQIFTNNKGQEENRLKCTIEPVKF